MKFVYVLGMLAMMIVPASATPLVTNGGFDSSCADWTFANTDGFTCATTTGPAGQPGDPSPFAILNNSPGIIPQVTQTIAWLTNGTSYTLAWEMQSAYRCCSSSSTPGVGAEIDGHLFEFIVPNTQTTWTGYTETFTYSGVSNLLRFTAQRNGTDTDVAIDNVSITANSSSVPEPGTYLLVTFGLVLGALRRVRSLK